MEFCSHFYCLLFTPPLASSASTLSYVLALSLLFESPNHLQHLASHVQLLSQP